MRTPIENEAPALTPGPAFIPWRTARSSEPLPDRTYFVAQRAAVPLGYIWCPATHSTMAGWARPMGGNEHP